MSVDQIEIPFYYNTNGINGAELVAEIDRAAALESQVYTLFLGLGLNVGKCWSDVQTLIHAHTGETHNEISVKRSLSNLKTKKWLVKVKVPGVRSIYKKTVSHYMLNPNVEHYNK